MSSTEDLKGKDAEGSGEKKEVVITDFPVQSVVVYPDRAEVTRLMKIKLGTGAVEIVVKNLSKCLDKDSIRVDGIGAASITEVSFQEISVTNEEDDQTNATEEVKELKQQSEELRVQISSMVDQLARVSMQINLLIKYSGGLLNAGGEANTSDLLDIKTIDGIFDFLDTYEERTFKLKVTKHDGELEKKRLEKALEKKQARLQELLPRLQKTPEPVKQQVLGILLTVQEEAEIKLMVTYVVSNASWSPKYDLRVSSVERTMLVNYFGMVQQNTGEDWLDAKLSLSTAMPSIGGTAPKLDTCKLTLILDAYPSRDKGSTRARSSYVMESTATIEAPGAQVSEGLSSSVFEITTLANIPADQSGHKVHVATIRLKPTFEYITVPKLAQHAFLKAKVTNDSNYPFLSGPANVFLDQSYVTETSVKSTAPMEELSCSLGMDPSVKVVYKPVKRSRVESGILSKNVTYSYKQMTEICNTRSETATVTFLDQLPKSENEKLKVNLIRPVLTKHKPGDPLPNPHLNRQNNVEWRVELKPEETKALTIEYMVEFPANKAGDVEGL